MVKFILNLSPLFSSEISKIIYDSENFAHWRGKKTEL